MIVFISENFLFNCFFFQVCYFVIYIKLFRISTTCMELQRISVFSDGVKVAAKFMMEIFVTVVTNG